jgi:hypothetical protein
MLGQPSERSIHFQGISTAQDSIFIPLKLLYRWIVTFLIHDMQHILAPGILRLAFRQLLDGYFLHRLRGLRSGIVRGIVGEGAKLNSSWCKTRHSIHPSSSPTIGIGAWLVLCMRLISSATLCCGPDLFTTSKSYADKAKRQRTRRGFLSLTDTDNSQRYA